MKTSDKQVSPCEGTNSKYLTVLEFGKVKMKVAQSCTTLCDSMDCILHGILQNTGVGSLSLLQGIFPTQGLNPGLPETGTINMSRKTQRCV